MKLRTAFVILVIVLVAASFSPAQSQPTQILIIKPGERPQVCAIHEGANGPILVCS